MLICSSRFSWCDEFQTVDPLRTTLPVHLFQGGVEGDVPLIEAGSSGTGPTLGTPSLHIISTMDPLRGASESMAELFLDARCESFANTHKPPNQKVHAPSILACSSIQVQHNGTIPLSPFPFALRATPSPVLTLVRHGTTVNQGGRCCARLLRCRRGRGYWSCTGHVTNGRQLEVVRTPRRTRLLLPSRLSLLGSPPLVRSLVVWMP